MGKGKRGHSCNFSIAVSHPVPSVIISPAESAQQVGLKQLRNDLAKTGMKKACSARKEGRKKEMEQKLSADTGTLQLTFQK